MRETVARFGAELFLTGIATEPPGERTRDVGLLVLNAGLIHRVGPNLIGVQVARRAAGAGFVALRFDLSNLGDSRGRNHPLPAEASAVADVREAMDHLGRTHALERFVLFGICSGAANAFRTALEDSRVVGAVLVDTYAYRTLGYYVRHYAPHVLRLKSWRKLLLERGALGRWLGRQRAQPDGNGPGAAWAPTRRFPPRASIETSFVALVERGVELLVVYTLGGMSDHYCYEGQFYDCFPALRGARSVQVVFLPAADHLLTRHRSREALLGAIGGWADRFPWREREPRVSLTG